MIDLSVSVPQATTAYPKPYPVDMRSSKRVFDDLTSILILAYKGLIDPAFEPLAPACVKRPTSIFQASFTLAGV